MMNSHLPADVPAADADGGTSAAGSRPGRRLITVLLLTAAALDLTRCGLVLATAEHAAPAAGLVAAGLAAAALSLWTARGCQGGRRWPGWAALLIGAASAPQAAASGHLPPPEGGRRGDDVRNSGHCQSRLREDGRGTPGPPADDQDAHARTGPRQAWADIAGRRGECQ